MLQAVMIASFFSQVTVYAHPCNVEMAFELLEMEICVGGALCPCRFKSSYGKRLFIFLAAWAITLTEFLQIIVK